jgi:hypothetical protein
MKTGRTPLKTPPLHNPGESLQQHRDNLLYDKLLPYWITSLCLVIWTTFEWLRHLGILPLHPAILTVFALGSIVVSIWKYRQVQPQVQNCNLGLDAEKSVGQYLEQFRAKDYEVIHDVPGQNGDRKFNIDHVLVGPGGIFTIETKGRTKPEKGPCEIDYDGHRVLINGQQPDRDPIVQAQSQAKWLIEMLQQSTGKTFPVTPLVVYPGWCIKRTVKNPTVPVLNEQVIGKFISRSWTHLALEDIHLVADRLTRYIQNFPK